MRRSKQIKLAMGALWGVMVLGIVLAIYRQDHFFAVDTKAIANLEKKTGSVVVRHEGRVRWRDTVEHQGLLDGDRLATGRAANAVIRFGQGRTLTLGEDTQVQITGILTGHRDYAFVIKLLRGSTVAEVKAKCGRDCSPLIMRVGETTENVAAGGKVGVMKQAGEKAKRFDPEGAWPVLKHEGGGTMALAAQSLDKEPDPTPEPSPSPSPSPTPAASPSPTPKTPTKSPSPTPTPLKASGFEPTVQAPAGGLVYWTAKPLSAMSDVAFDLPLTAPGSAPSGEWKPLVEVAGGGKSSVLSVDPKEMHVRLPLMKLRGLATVSWRGGIKEYSVVVRGGAEVGSGKQKVSSFSNHRLTLKVITLGEPGGGSFALGLDGLGSAGDDGAWLAPKAEVAPEGAPLVIKLVNGGDYGRLLGAIRASAHIGIGRGAGLGGAGLFLVRDQKIIAEVAGPGGPGAVQSLVALLGADFAFRGNRSAFHDTHAAGSVASADWMGALLDKGQVLYILKRNKLYPVSREFIKTNAEVAAFVDNQAHAVFLEKVEIVAFK